MAQLLPEQAEVEHVVPPAKTLGLKVKATTRLIKITFAALFISDPP